MRIGPTLSTRYPWTVSQHTNTQTPHRGSLVVDDPSGPLEASHRVSRDVYVPCLMQIYTKAAGSVPGLCSMRTAWYLLCISVTKCFWVCP